MYKFSLIILLLFVFFATGFSQTVPPPVQLINTANFVALDSIKPLNVATVNTQLKIMDNQACASCLSGCGALPVTLISFDGKRVNNNTVILNWKTANEFNSKGFELERSLGNAGLFNEVAFIPSKGGNSLIRKYHFPDFNDYQGDSYYRLTQTDFDGKMTYSKVVVVGGFDTDPSMILYPNPVSSNLVVTIYFPQNESAKLMLLDATQKLIIAKNLSLAKGANLINLSVNFLSPGIYFIKIICSNYQVLNGKFIKL